MSLDSPPYTQSIPAPNYTPEPLENEERLEYTCRVRNLATPTGVFTQASDYITVTLTEQDDNTAVPLYHQNGLVSGTASVGDPDKISAVIVTVCFEFNFTITALMIPISLKAGLVWRLRKTILL